MTGKGNPSWPEDGSPADFGDIVDPLIKAFNAGATYQVRPSMNETDIPWTGLSWESPAIPSIPDRLSADLREHDRDQGRTFLSTILSIAVNLGMEQDCRIGHQSRQFDVKAMRSCLRVLESSLDSLEDKKP